MKSQQLSQVGSRPVVQVTLPVFEGPFDLLIYLVQRDKLDIHSIAIADITRSYLESLSLVEFDPELASDFIYMAAYLLELKSRSLLPRVERELLADEPDPRQELILRLVQYKRFKDLAGQLEKMISLDNYDYTRQPDLPPDPLVRPLVPMSLDNLFSAFARALERSKVEVRQLAANGVPIGVRLEQLRQRLAKGSATFDELARGLGLEEIIVTFLAVLELVRLGEALVFQQEVFAPIVIESVKDDRDG
ncbi:MAG: segregation/condensation protein A [Firmicutes bacterium]|nr:segregation/condensation protein A [Bacillota bacterium]